MPRDTLGTTSSIAGAPLTVNPGDTISIGGDMIIFDGVPHVAWCEQTTTDGGVPETIHGPYVARWDGAGWTLLTAQGALPDTVDFGDPSLQVPLDQAHSCPAIDRLSPKLATDGTSLYVGVLANFITRFLNPPFNPFFIFSYYSVWAVYGFRLDGGTWTPLGDPLLGMFPETLQSQGLAFNTGSLGAFGFFDWDISASPASPGNCYFAFSYHGYNQFPFLGTPATVNELAVVGTDLAETLLANDTDYSTTLVGGGPTLTLYASPGQFGPPFTYDHVPFWTPSGTGEVDAADFDIPYTSTVMGIDSAVEVDGVRYPVFSGEFDVGGNRWNVVVQTSDPSTPATVEHLVPAFATYPTPDLDIAYDLAGGGYTADDLIVESRNYWLPLSDLSAGPFSQVVVWLDRQCPAPSVGWIPNIGAILPDALFRDGTVILYQDALWWFTVVGAPYDTSDRVPQVWRTPICRGCEPCPEATLHIWQRFSLVG